MLGRIKVFLGLLPLFIVNDVMASCSNENTATVASTPSSDFTVNSDGTVSHNISGLMWMRCSIGQTWSESGCTGTASTYNWQDALGQAQIQNTAEYAGYDDWRLPNKNELATIIEFSCYQPALNSEIFPDNLATERFWSSSTSYSSNAWSVSFDVGNILALNKGSSFSVRLVRDDD